MHKRNTKWFLNNGVEENNEKNVPFEEQIRKDDIYASLMPPSAYDETGYLWYSHQVCNQLAFDWACWWWRWSVKARWICTRNYKVGGRSCGLQPPHLMEFICECKRRGHYRSRRGRIFWARTYAAAGAHAVCLWEFRGKPINLMISPIRIRRATTHAGMDQVHIKPLHSPS